MAKRRQDRTLNIDTVENTTTVERVTIASTGALYDTNNISSTASRYRRERVPTGGVKKIPLEEKPFRNGTLTVSFPIGTLTRKSGKYLYTSTGRHSGVYNMYGGAFNGDLRFPMNAGLNAKYRPATSVYPPSVNVDLLSQAEVKCLNKLKGKSADDQLEFGLVWAERHETVALFTEASVALLHLAKALKRGDAAAAIDVLIQRFRMPRKGLKERFKRDWRRGTKTAAGLLERLASATLAWNLGISPLLNDLETAVKLLQTGLLTKDWNIKSVSSYARTVNEVEVVPFVSQNASCKQEVSDVHGYTVVLIAQPLFSTRALLGTLGLTNLPNLAYQSTRATFILDYFLAVGPWLEAMEVPSLFEFKQGSKTQSVKRIFTLNMFQGTAKALTGGYVLTYADRKLYNSFPIPLFPLSFREQRLKDKQLLNTGLVALMDLRRLVGK